jgi:hypothetical protein
VESYPSSGEEADDHPELPITMYSPGSISMRSIAEPFNKFFYHFANGNIERAPLSEQHVNLETRHFEEFDLEDEGDLQDFEHEPISRNVREYLDALPEVIAKPLIRVKYQDDIPDVYDRIRSAVGDQAYLFTSPVAAEQDSPEVEDQERRDVIDQGLAGALGLVVDPDSEEYQTATRLLSSSGITDLRELLITMRREHMNAIPPAEETQTASD